GSGFMVLGSGCKVSARFADAINLKEKCAIQLRRHRAPRTQNPEPRTFWSVHMSVDQQVADFVGQVVKQMGLGLQARVETNADGTRIDLEGDGAETLLARRGEGLPALQHIVDSAFRKQLGDKRLLIDCMGFRRDKDNELK